MQIYGKYEKDYHKACHLFIEERYRFQRLLEQIPFLHVMPSQANYFLCEVTEKYTSAELANILMRNDIIISDCNRKTHRQKKQIIRLAIRSKEDNDLLIQKLQGL